MRFSIRAVVALTATGLLAQVGLSGPASAASSTGHHKTWLINTVAGGVGGPGLAERIPVQPCAVAVVFGGVYAIDQVLTFPPGISEAGSSVIRLVSRRTGALTTPAGDGGPGASADGTPGRRAGLGRACAITVDHAGNVLFSQDEFGVGGGRGFPIDRIRVLATRSGRFYGQVMKAGDIYTIAGNGKVGHGGDGGPALKARLDLPGGLAVDAVGNVLVEDAGDDRIRVVAERTGTFYGQAMKAGDIYRIAGIGRLGFSGDGVPALTSELGTYAYEIDQADEGIGVDRNGNVVIADYRNNRVRVIAARTGAFYGQAMTAGDIYTIAGNGSDGASGNGGPATAASVGAPVAIALDRSGNIVVSQQGDCHARVIAASSGPFYGQNMTAGDIYAIGGRAACASQGVAVDRAGNVITAGGRLGLIAVASGRFYGQSVQSGGQYVITSVKGASRIGSGQPPTRVEIWPQSVALDSAGDLLMVDFAAKPFRQPAGLIRLVPARPGRLFGRSVRRGRIYTIARGVNFGYGDNLLQGIAADRFGNALISVNNAVDVLAARTGRFYGQAMTAGHLYLVAGGGTSGGSGVPAKSVIMNPNGLTTDRAGNIVIAMWFEGVVQVVAVRTGTFYGLPMKAGDIYTIAGGAGHEINGVPGLESSINPVDVAIDHAGNIVVSDVINNTVRVIAARSGRFYGQQMTPGDIYGLAGNGHEGFSGDGGPAAHAKFDGPCGVAVDVAGNVVIADLDNFRVRVVAVRSGTFYGRAMKAGRVYTIAGSGKLPGDPFAPPSADGTLDFADGIAAQNAQLLEPLAVAVEAPGRVLVSDGYRVRVIEP